MLLVINNLKKENSDTNILATKLYEAVLQSCQLPL